MHGRGAGQVGAVEGSGEWCGMVSANPGCGQVRGLGDRERSLRNVGVAAVERFNGLLDESLDLV
jgi:hypothetical protein